MITIRKHALSGVSGGRRQSNPCLPPAQSKLIQVSAPPQMPTAERKRVAVYDRALTAGMRRIYEQYKAGTYDANDYSQRSCQRHRKYFLSIGIDLRKPFSPSTSIKMSVPASQPKQRAKILPATKKTNQLPAPESAPPTSEPTCRKAKCASDAISKSHRTRVQRHRTARAVGLGAIARSTR